MSFDNLIKLFSSICYSVVERELNVPLPISKIIKKWNNLLQEYKHAHGAEAKQQKATKRFQKEM
ncbi:CLUMA_CG013474, isoform A [Clunio marinus]|uniref:CLUMA_CG013474, isoform A n=1 Tax=Clunio marinus TaxID=568069 RepID=A0A1J1IJ22_9DIPT|nr:CLUMA_CG013474, isoform A [Clunio marinus]